MPVRVVILSSAPTPHLSHLFARLRAAEPAPLLVGVLHELRPGEAVSRWLPRDARRYWREPAFTRYVAGELTSVAREICTAGRNAAVRRLAGTGPARAEASLEELAQSERARGVDFCITTEIHSPESHETVRAMDADLGIVFGARILRASLHSIPWGGSINNHQHALPEFRGSGRPGLWELRAGAARVVLVTHIVTDVVDGGDILDERSFPIAPADTWHSLELKANLLGIDGLVDVVARWASGRPSGRPQPASGTTFKGVPPHRMAAMERAALRAHHAAARPATGVRRRPSAKAAVRWARSLGRCGPEGPRVLALSPVCDSGARGTMPTAQFDAHVTFLKKYRRTVRLDEAFPDTASGPAVADAVVLTLDADGRLDPLGLRAVVEVAGAPVTLLLPVRPLREALRTGESLTGPGTALSWEEVAHLVVAGVTFGLRLEAPPTADIDARGALEEAWKGLRERVPTAVPWVAVPGAVSAVPDGLLPSGVRDCLVDGSLAPQPRGAVRLVRRLPHPSSLLDLEALVRTAGPSGMEPSH